MPCSDPGPRPLGLPVHLAWPVRIDPGGRAGPTAKEARGPSWRRTGHGLYLPADVEQTTGQRIVEAAAVLPAYGGVTGWAGLAWLGGRWFDGGMFAGKRAMCAVTVGGSDGVYSHDGVYGPIEDILFPIHRGIFQFTGFSVVEPFVVYGPGRIDAAARDRHLAAYAARLLGLAEAPVLSGPSSIEFDGLVRRRTGSN